MANVDDLEPPPGRRDSISAKGTVLRPSSAIDEAIPPVPEATEADKPQGRPPAGRPNGRPGENGRHAKEPPSTWEDVQSDLDEVPLNCGKMEQYEMGKAIGNGKFSVVYRAKDHENNKMVALKKIQIFDIMDAKSRKKCLREVKLLQSLSRHPNLITYLDAFIEQNELIIVFEWAEQGDLRRMLRHMKSPLEEHVVWTYFAQVCGAVAHMHEQRIMHRDIKPANIFLTSNSVLKLGDLGLGRSLSDQSIEAFSKVGTPLYMSPEVLHGQGYDLRSDVWSLGCLLYELTMLRSPFEGENQTLYDIFSKINACKFPPIPETYSDELRSLVNLMIQTDPQRRPDCAVCFKVALEQVAKAKCTRSVHVLMPELVDKMRMLDYLALCCVPRGVAPLTPTSFSIDMGAGQFEHLQAITTWLLEVCGRPASSTTTAYSDRNAACAFLLQECRALGVAGVDTISPVRLKQGWGEAVLLLLHWLADRALVVTGVKFNKPALNPDGEPEETVPEDCTDVDEAETALLSPTSPAPDTEASDTDTFDSGAVDARIVRPLSPSGLGESLTPLRSLDGVGDGGWRGRLLDAVNGATVFAEELPSATQSLTAAVKSLHGVLESIGQRENAIRQEFSHLADEYKAIKCRMEQVAAHHSEIQERVADMSVGLAGLDDQLIDLKAELEEKQAGLTNRSPITRITTAITALRSDVRDLDIRLGLVSHSLLERRLKQREEKDEQVFGPDSPPSPDTL